MVVEGGGREEVRRSLTGGKVELTRVRSYIDIKSSTPPCRELCCFRTRRTFLVRGPVYSALDLVPHLRHVPHRPACSSAGGSIATLRAIRTLHLPASDGI